MRKSQLFYLFQAPLMAVVLTVGGSVWSDELLQEIEHPGYLNSVVDERYQVTKEVMIVPPPEDDQPLWMNRIFTAKLTKEFKEEFRQRFGYTEFEQIEYTSNPMIEMGGSISPLVQVDDHVEKQKAFGQYIGKELSEYHLNSYLKGNRNTRAVYKVKEAVTNVEFSAGKSGAKVKYRYKLSSNRVILALAKPNESFHKSVDFNPTQNPNPTVRLGYDVSKTVGLSSAYAVDERITTLQARKRLTRSLSTSLTGQDYAKAIGANTPKQQRVLLGLSWSD